MKKNLNLYLLRAYNASAQFTSDKFILTISLFSLLFVLISMAAGAQTAYDQSAKVISGVVRDDEQQPLIGVSVSVKGTNLGVLTDENGRFSISVDVTKYDALVFSYLAKKTSELSIKEKGTSINLTLYDDPSVFTELVVTGDAASDQVYTEQKSTRKARKTKRLF